MSEQETTVRERVMRWLSTPGVGILLAAIITSWFALTQVLNANAGDVIEYEQYARAFWFGSPPFRALPFEYPPLALAPFTLTLFPTGAGPYVAFGIWMGVVDRSGLSDAGPGLEPSRRDLFWYLSPALGRSRSRSRATISSPSPSPWPPGSPRSASASRWPTRCWRLASC